jgi:hypothetical protein
MADPTREMTQRAAAYVPEGLRPNGWRERMGWYGGKPWQVPSEEREYDTRPFEHPSTWGADMALEVLLKQILFGNRAQQGLQAVEDEKKRKAEEERKRKEAPLVGPTNVDTNRFGTQGEFGR